MLRLDPSILPDPSKPQKWDAYGSEPGKHDLVVQLATFNDYERSLKLTLYLRGELRNMDESMFIAFLASLALQPTGRMTSEPLKLERREAGLPPWPILKVSAAWRDGLETGRAETLDPPDGGLCEPEHRRLARMFGPLLRSLREKHGVGLGRLARALGCQTAALSAFELGERPGDKQPAGTSEMDRAVQRSLHPAGQCTCGGERTCAWCKMDESRGIALAGGPPAQMTVMRLSGHETSWYTAHKTGYVDFNDADYIVDAGERYRVHEGRFEIEATKPACAPVDNVAIETGRDVLTAALAKAVWLAQDSRHEATMLRSDEYATIHTAIHEALKEPEAREGFKLYADGLAPDEPGPDPATLASWIANSIGFEFHVLDRDGLNAADPALAYCIRRAIETAPAG